MLQLDPLLCQCLTRMPMRVKKLLVCFCAGFPAAHHIQTKGEPGLASLGLCRTMVALLLSTHRCQDSMGQPVGAGRHFGASSALLPLLFLG